MTHLLVKLCHLQGRVRPRIITSFTTRYNSKMQLSLQKSTSQSFNTCYELNRRTEDSCALTSRLVSPRATVYRLVGRDINSREHPPLLPLLPAAEHHLLHHQRYMTPLQPLPSHQSTVLFADKAAANTPPRESHTSPRRVDDDDRPHLHDDSGERPRGLLARRRMGFVDLTRSRSQYFTGDPRRAYTRVAEYDQLQQLKHHVERRMPCFFIEGSDYSVFTSDVIYQKLLRDSTKEMKGIAWLSWEFMTYRAYYNVNYSFKKLLIDSIVVDEKESTLRIHFRVRCLGGRQTFIRFKDMSLFDHEGYIAKLAEWHDYILILHVTDDARVWKMRLTSVTESRDSVWSRSMTFLQRLQSRLWRPAARPA